MRLVLCPSILVGLDIRPKRARSMDAIDKRARSRDRVSKHPIVFMPGALWAPVSNPTRRLGAQLKLRGAEAAESRQCAVIDMGDDLCITLQLVWL